MIVMKDLGGTDAPTPDMILRGTILQSVLMPSHMGCSNGAHLDLLLQHAVDNLKIWLLKESFKSSIIPTHTLSRRIRSHIVKGLVKGPSIQLGDGTHIVIKGVWSARVLSDDFWKQASRSVVAHIGGEHIKLAVRDDGSVMENHSSPQVPLKPLPL